MRAALRYLGCLAAALTCSAVAHEQSAQQFSAVIRSEIAKWAKAVKASGAMPE